MLVNFNNWQNLKRSKLLLIMGILTIFIAALLYLVLLMNNQISFMSIELADLQNALMNSEAFRTALEVDNGDLEKVTQDIDNEFDQLTLLNTAAIVLGVGFIIFLLLTKPES